MSKTELLSALARLREEFPTLTKVVIHYCGSGDEGSVEEIAICCGEQHHDQPALDWRHPLYSELEQFADDAIDSYYAGWENGDGGSGRVEIDAGTARATLHHAWYQTVTEEEPDVELELKSE